MSLQRIRATRLALFLAACAALGSGCASKRVKEVDRIPLHLALIPVDTRADQLSAPSWREDFDPEDALQIESESFSTHLRDALAGGAFVEVTLLRPEEGAEGPLRDADWVKLAHEADADLLADCSLTYVDVYESQRNEMFWFNLPLFVFALPFTFFVDDRTYEVQVSLEGSIHDLRAIAPDVARLADAHAEILQLDSVAREARLDFVDRAGTKFSRWMPTLIVPVGFLSPVNGQVKQSLETEIVQDIAERFRRAVLDRHSDLVRADQVSSFWFAPEGTGAVRTADGTITVAGDVLLRPDRRVSRMEFARIVPGGGEPVDVVFADEEPEYVSGSAASGGQRVRKYRLEAEVAAAGDARTVRVILEDGSDDRNQRSYTLLIADPPGISTARQGTRAASGGASTPR